MIPLFLAVTLLRSQGGRDPNATAFTSPLSTPLRSQSIDLSRELAAAQKAWGVALDNVSIRWEDIGPCKPVGFHASFRQVEAGVYNGHASAIEHTIQDVVTFEDGTMVGSTRFVVSLNSSCDWERLPLRETIMHEVGHALGLRHSRDKHDIMYPVPARGQRISREDRESIR